MVGDGNGGEHSGSRRSLRALCFKSTLTEGTRHAPDRKSPLCRRLRRAPTRLFQNALRKASGFTSSNIFSSSAFDLCSRGIRVVVERTSALISLIIIIIDPTMSHLSFERGRQRLPRVCSSRSRRVSSISPTMNLVVGPEPSETAERSLRVKCLPPTIGNLAFTRSLTKPSGSPRHKLCVFVTFSKFVSQRLRVFTMYRAFSFPNFHKTYSFSDIFF